MLDEVLKLLGFIEIDEVLVTRDEDDLSWRAVIERAGARYDKRISW